VSAIVVWNAGGSIAFVSRHVNFRVAVNWNKSALSKYRTLVYGAWITIIAYGGRIELSSFWITSVLNAGVTSVRRGFGGVLAMISAVVIKIENTTCHLAKIIRWNGTDFAEVLLDKPFPAVITFFIIAEITLKK